MIQHTLSNGIRIVAESIPTSRSVSFGIWVNTGSRYEHPEQNGISHFIEHMLFKGTASRTAKDIADCFDSIGGNVNAFTSKEYTCYYAKVLDTHLPIAVDVLADMFFCSLLTDQDLVKEKNVIFEEIAMYEDTPDDFVHDLITTVAYGDHPLARPILGSKELLTKIDSSALRQYMDTHYCIENIVISAAGHIPDNFIDLMEKHFGSFSNHGHAPVSNVPVYIADTKFRQKETEQNHICLSLPGCSLKDERIYAMILLNNLIGGGMSSRLFQEIRERRGLAYSVYSYHSAHLDTGLFTIYTGTHPSQTNDVLKLTIEILDDFVHHGMTEAELHRCKEQLKGSMILGLEGTSSRMNRLGKNELMLKRHLTLDEVIHRIDRVTNEDINQLIKDLFANPFSFAMVGTSDQALSTFRRDPLVIPDSD